MKKRFLIRILFILLLITAVPAAAPASVCAAKTLYVKKDGVKVFKKQDTSSTVLKKLKKGDKIVVEKTSKNKKWVSARFQISGKKQTGWVRTANLSSTKPVCSHKWTEWQTTRAATCTAGGQKTRTCRKCGARQVTVIAPLGHKYGSWTVTKKATCTAAGSKTRVCKRCGKKNTQSIAKKAHNFSSWTVSKKATCTQQGSRYRTCKTCGKKETQKLAKLSHTYGSWTVIRKATCSKKGKKQRTCKVCGYVQTKKTKKKAHKYEWKIITEPTDHSAGVRTAVCKVCGHAEENVNYYPDGTLMRGDRGEKVREVQQLLADQNYLNAGGADGIYGGSTEMAVKMFQNDQGLTADGIAWPQTIARLQHTFGKWKVVTKLTQDNPGGRQRTCKDCGYVQHDVILLSPVLERGQRGENVRTAQMMLSQLGYDTGSLDGIYGKKLDEAYAAFAKDRGEAFSGGKLTPAKLDTLANAWMAAVPADEWMGTSGLESPVNVALTVTRVSGKAKKGMSAYSWSATNMGSETCSFVALLLSYGDTPDFRNKSYVMVLDGEQLKAACGSSVSGSFEVNADWGEGMPHFSALAISEKTGAKWLSIAQ